MYLKRTGKLKFDFEKLVVVSIIDYLELFQLDFENQIKFLDSLVDRKLYLEDFRKDRKLYIKIANSYNNWEGLKAINQGTLIRKILARREPEVNRFIQKLKLLEFRKRLFNSKRDIMASIIHLHCNRLMGINRIYEEKLMTLARHSLHNLKFFKKKNEQIIG